MPVSKKRKGHAKRAAHNRLMLQHSRHTNKKRAQEALDTFIDQMKEQPKNVAEMLDKEEKEEVDDSSAETVKECDQCVDCKCEVEE